MFMNIDNQISRLAKKLPDVQGLPQMAAALNSLTGEATVIDDLGPSGALGTSNDIDDDEVDLS